MNPRRSTNFRRFEETSSAHKECNTGSFLHTRTEEEKQRRREQWKIQQELERQHEKLKREKIKEYERKRAESLKCTKQTSSRTRSKSNSKSPSHSWNRERSTSPIPKSRTLFEKLDGSSSGAVRLFKGPESTPISTMELRRIKVDIRRNIPAQASVTELHRDIVAPEDVIVKRRDGEGCTPIFDRAEIAERRVREVEEQRTVVAIDREQSVSNNSYTSKRRSPSTHRRNRSYSPARSFDHSRYRRDSKDRNSRANYHDRHKIDGGNSIEKHREYKDKYIERDGGKRNGNRSRSRERSSHSRQYMEERSYRDRYRDRSSDRSHERRDRGRDRNKSTSRERRGLTPHYIEPVHVPIYYSNFPRPIVVGPMVPVRGQVPPMGRGRHPNLMAPVRPFLPRFVPPDMYRFGPPGNPRYGPIF